MFVQLKEFPRYFVTDEGQIVDTLGGVWKEKRQPGSRYWNVCLVRPDGSRAVFAVHRLVLKAFCGHSDLVVDHKDCNTRNNRLENLHYVTQAENMRLAWERGRIKFGKGEKHRMAKLTDAQVQELKALKFKMTQKAAAEMFGVSVSCVAGIWNRLTRR